MQSIHKIKVINVDFKGNNKKRLFLINIVKRYFNCARLQINHNKIIQKGKHLKKGKSGNFFYQKMEKVVVGTDEPQLLIDRCSKKHGLWFDSGELQDIMNRAKLDTDSRINQLLSEMFSNRPELCNKEPEND